MLSDSFSRRVDVSRGVVSRVDVCSLRFSVSSRCVEVTSDGIDFASRGVALL